MGDVNRVSHCLSRLWEFTTRSLAIPDSWARWLNQLMKTVYLLPCGCGRQTEVEAGQAGSEVQCACGKSLSVPSVRGLRDLEKVEKAGPQAARAQQPWSTWRGTTFSLGLVVMAIALGFVAVNGYWFWASRRLGDPAKFELESVLHQVEHLSALEIITEFRTEAQAGLGEPFPPVWTHIDRFHEESRNRMIVAAIVMGLGLLATGSSMLGRNSKRT